MKNTRQAANRKTYRLQKQSHKTPEVLLITSYPPRECGIATYSQDLLSALQTKFKESFSLRVCALESKRMGNSYPDEVKYKLDPTDQLQCFNLSNTINDSEDISMVLIQHEFGLFPDHDLFLKFLFSLNKPIAIVFHTVIPFPDETVKIAVRNMIAASASVIVMTKHAATILQETYETASHKIAVIPHGTHLVQHENRNSLKEKYGLKGKKVLSTFGLLSSGKGIENTLEALPQICAENPDVVFLILGKTHPEIVSRQGEVYRNSLVARVAELGVEKNVLFINRYLSLPHLLEYLQLTDIYLFSSLDPHQAVSGTFAYAMSCGCPIISMPIPQATLTLNEETGIIVDFKNTEQLSGAVNKLLGDQALQAKFRANTLQQIVPTSWENSATLHAKLFKQICAESNIAANGWYIPQSINLSYSVPPIHLSHVEKMTTEVGIIQFSQMNEPDIASGYTLDDNARALIAMGMYYERTGDHKLLSHMKTYLKFIQFCQQPDGGFLNYVDSEQRFTEQNKEINLSDSNGRAVWALGYLISIENLLPKDFGVMARNIFERTKQNITGWDSPRAIAFAIKGLYFSNIAERSMRTSNLIQMLAERLTSFYRSEAENGWLWFEPYMTYANAVLPEAMLCAWQDQGYESYKKIAKSSFDFLISLLFKNHQIKVISNKSWLHKGGESEPFGEQPIDIAYTILALHRFNSVFGEQQYAEKLKIAFDWFLGNNHLNQIIYNPTTGGCFDGLEETQVNLNQGAESTLSYIISRLIIEQKEEVPENAGLVLRNSELQFRIL